MRKTTTRLAHREMRVTTTQLAHTASHVCLRFEGDCADQKVIPYITRGKIDLEEKWHTFVNFSCRDETLVFCRNAKVWDFCIDGPTQTTVVGQSLRLAPFRQQAWVDRFEAMEAFVTKVSEQTETPYIVIIDAPPADEIVDAQAHLMPDGKPLEWMTTSMPLHTVAIVLFSSEREYVMTDKLHFGEALITNQFLNLSPTRYVISPGIPSCGVQKFFNLLFGAYKTTNNARTRLTISVPSAFRMVNTLGHLQECKNAYEITVGNLQHNLKFSVGDETKWAITVIGEWYETENVEGAIKDASTEHTNAMLEAIVATCDEVGAHAAAHRLMTTDVDAMHGLANLAVEHCNTSWQTALMRHRQKRGGSEPPLLRPPALPKRTHSHA